MADHVDPAELAEIALENGENGQNGDSVRFAEQRLHLAVCSECRRELEALRAVVRAARSAGPGDLVTEPPDRVWRSIQRELGAADPPSEAESSEPRAAPTVTPYPGTLRGSRRPARALAALALAVGLATGGGVAWWQANDSRPQTVQSVGAPHRLAPRPGHSAVGTAGLADSSAEGRVLQITVHGLPDTKGYFEVWLMDRSGSRLIPVGALGQDGRATLPMPDGVDLPAYPMVDVSDQAYDGNPAHSGRSVVRGALVG
ncbi:anti-sigma factor [Streptomyces sp. NPDC051219]|uniref:anti-sigma factor n=1 Tax=Streptomyces sp. NPDC051219 TaxID=3155283 RepID=UPI00341CE6D7